MFLHPVSSLAALALFLVSGQAVRLAATLKPVAQALPAEAREFLDTHNRARAAVGVEPLEWSATLAKYASLIVRYQRDKLACTVAVLNNKKFGSNQDLAGEGAEPSYAVEQWLREKDFYIHKNNLCVAPNNQCWHYTQVVWRKSKQLGCAQVSCENEGISLAICFYYPPGNVIGESPY